MRVARGTLVVLCTIVGFSALLPISAQTGEFGDDILDCEDWQILDPRFSCADWFQCNPWAGDNCPPQIPGYIGPAPWQNPSFMDNEGRLVNFNNENATGCPGTARTLQSTQDGTSWSPIALLQPPCGAGHLLALDPLLHFDPVNGRVGIIYTSWHEYSVGNVATKVGVFIQGFATTFEIMQTYQPLAGGFTFRVPVMPEGLPAASFFDTYVGTLSTVSDFSQAQPLQCGFPATQPNVGDYLTVADTLPDPVPGRGRYYLIVVNYQGQRRYGRQNVGGTLTGRDPAVLPACQ